MTLFFKNRIESGDALPSIFPDSDFIIAEGFKADKAFRVEVTGMLERTEEMKNPASETDLIVYGSSRLFEQLQTQSPANEQPVLIDREEVSEAADYLCRRL